MALTPEEIKAKAEQEEKERLEREAKEKEEKEKAEKEKNEKDKLFSEEYVKGIRAEAAKYRTKAKELEEKLGKLDSLDVEEYERLKKEKEENERQKLEAKGEFDKLKDQLQNSHGKELGKKDEVIAQLNAKVASLELELNKTILENAIAVEAAAAKCLNPRMLSMWIANEAKVEQLEDGRRYIKLVDEAGTSKINAKGEPMNIRERIAEMKMDENFAMLFEGGIPGAGSRTSGGGGKVANPFKPETFNLTEQGKLVRENPVLAKKLAEEVGITLNI